MATISLENKEMSGDIIALRPEGVFLTEKFSIEAKVGYPQSNFHKHMKRVKGCELKAFWKQCVRDATRADKMPMLIYKKKGHNALVGVTWTNEKLGELQSITMNFAKEEDLPVIHFFDMEQFLNTVTPEDIKKL